MKLKEELENKANEKEETTVSKQEEKKKVEEIQPKEEKVEQKKPEMVEKKTTKSKKKTSLKANTIIETRKEESVPNTILQGNAEVTILGQETKKTEEQQAKVSMENGKEKDQESENQLNETKNKAQNNKEQNELAKNEEINEGRNQITKKTKKAINKREKNEAMHNEIVGNNETKETKNGVDQKKEKNETESEVVEKAEEANKEEQENRKISENETTEEGKAEKKKKSHRRTKVLAIILAILVFIGLAFSTVFALINKGSDKVIEGVQIKGINVSGLTREEAENRLNEIFSEQLKKEISLKHGEYETKLTPEQIELNFKVSEAVEFAYSRGRTGNILKDNYDILNAKWNVFEITPEYTYNDELLTTFLAGTQENLPDIVKQSSYSIEGSKLNIYKGEKGVAIEVEPLKKQIIEAGIDFSEAHIIEMPVTEVQPEPIDLNKIRNEIYKEPKNAYYTQNPFTIYPHVNGVDLNVSIEEAQNQVNASTEANVTIPLKITTPAVTTNHIGTEAFPDLLATFSTTFSTGNANRATNIRLASNKINGVVLLPGEDFYYNKVVGQRTAAAGFKSAGVYVNGRVENGIGGGICQVSSTLYNSVLRANLQIVKRSNHYFATGYVPLSTDATVSWGGPEFAFKNSRKYPIKIVSSVNGGKITISIYGCKEETEYEVIIQSQTLQTIPMKTERRVNPALPKGTTKTVQKGHGGYKSRAYRILKLNGTEVSRQLLSTDTYAQLSTIIETNP